MEELCSKIAVEKDPRKFLDLVQRLNDLLECSQRQLDLSRASAVNTKVSDSGAKNT